MRRLHAITLATFAAFATSTVIVPTAVRAQVSIGISVTTAPPELPIYVQPPIPEDGYIWTPGYWAYGRGGYYWVPGTWVLPPEPELLWTPAYWAWEGNVFIFHRGYWGPRVGYYGGINYGYGYDGYGYEGGYWDRGHFSYNRAVNNIRNVRVTNIYSKTIIHNDVSDRRVSYNGGAHGTNARPTSRDEAFEHDQHVSPTPLQERHEHGASDNRALLDSNNHGRPAIAATTRPAEFHGPGVVPSRGVVVQHRDAPAPREERPQAAPQPARNAPVMHTERPQAAPQPQRNEPPSGAARPESPHDARGGPPDRNNDRGRDQHEPNQNGPRDEHRDR